MRKQLLYIAIFILGIVACEEVYTPKLDNVDSFLVVEAIFISGEEQHTIYLYETAGFFDESSNYSPVSGASIFLVDKYQKPFAFKETESGTYQINHALNEAEQYSLYIELNGEVYESAVQSVPEKPVLDTVYGEYTSKVTTEGTANSADNIVTSYGIQLYTDMKDNGTLNHYRFYGRKIIQYFDYYDTLLPGASEPEKWPIYGWDSYSPEGSFNIAGPPKYSSVKSITRHSLEFFNQDYYKFIADTQSFAGWIYIIYQYGINEDTYNYYEDLNNQLEAEGKIFDPVYVEAEGNISCTSNPKINVLGNFEISSFNEKRYFLYYRRNFSGIDTIKNIPYFYNIPLHGYIKNDMPDFWERRSKSYPDE